MRKDPMRRGPMSRVVVDRVRCVGSGSCEASAPAGFEVDDDGALALLRPEPADDQLAEVRDAVQACPTRARTLAG
jgi:ferredoxin